MQGKESEYDYYYVSHRRNEIIGTISSAYFNLKKRILYSQ